MKRVMKRVGRGVALLFGYAYIALILFLIVGMPLLIRLFWVD